MWAGELTATFNLLWHAQTVDEVLGKWQWLLNASLVLRWYSGSLVLQTSGCRGSIGGARQLAVAAARFFFLISFFFVFFFFVVSFFFFGTT